MRLPEPPGCATEDGISRSWRDRPHLARRFINPALGKDFWKDRFALWAHDAGHIRLFLGGTTRRIGQAFDVPSATRALAIYEAYPEEPLTILLDDMRSADPALASIKARVGDRAHWRAYSAVSTLSSVSSGIGFHAGHEDAVIVQLGGVRRWRVWPPSQIREEYRLSLMQCPGYENVKPSLPDSAPSLDVVLEPGDALYVPPFFAHEGTTIQESVSLGIGWRGIWPHWLLRDIVPQVNLGPHFPGATHTEGLFSIIPDPPQCRWLGDEYLDPVTDACLLSIKSAGVDVGRETIHRAILHKLGLRAA